MFDPHLLAELRKQRRKAALPPMLFLLAMFVAGVLMVYFQTGSYNHVEWFIVFSLILIFIAAGWFFVVERGFLYYIERKSDEIEGFIIGRTWISLYTVNRLMLTIALPDEKQRDEVSQKLKAAFPKKGFRISNR